jgi:hypothetical protein
MTRKCKAHLFSVIPRSGTAEELAGLLTKFALKTKQLRFKSNQVGYLVEDAHQRGPARRVFTATIFKLQSSEFPSVVEGDAVKPLGLEDHHALGEAMCFAYDPTRQSAMIQSVGHGPRYAILRTFLEEIGFANYVDIVPVMRKDMLDRLEKTKYIRSVGLKVARPFGDEKGMKSSGVPIESAIDAMVDLGAEQIEIEIGMGRGKGQLNGGKVVRFIKKLLNTHDEGVKSLRLTGAEADGMSLQFLDLLGGRLETLVELKPVGREWDREHCQKQLAVLLGETDTEHGEIDPG